MNKRKNIIQAWLMKCRRTRDQIANIHWIIEIAREIQKNIYFCFVDYSKAFDWGQEEKGTTEDEMVRRHHRLSEHGFEETPGVGDEQGGLVCCSSWGHKELETTEQLNWTESFWLCGPQQTLETSLWDGNTRSPDLPLGKSVCRSGSNS